MAGPGCTSQRRRQGLRLEDRRKAREGDAGEIEGNEPLFSAIRSGAGEMPPQGNRPSAFLAAKLVLEKNRPARNRDHYRAGFKTSGSRAVGPCSV